MFTSIWQAASTHVPWGRICRSALAGGWQKEDRFPTLKSGPSWLACLLACRPRPTKISWFLTYSVEWKSCYHGWFFPLPFSAGLHDVGHMWMMMWVDARERTGAHAFDFHHGGTLLIHSIQNPPTSTPQHPTMQIRLLTTTAVCTCALPKMPRCLTLVSR